MMDEQSTSTAEIREELRAYRSLPSVNRRAQITIENTRIRPGDVLESPGRSQIDYKLVVDCGEDELICYLPQTDTYTSYPWDMVSLDLSEGMIIHHPQVIS